MNLEQLIQHAQAHRPLCWLNPHYQPAFSPSWIDAQIQQAEQNSEWLTTAISHLIPTFTQGRIQAPLLSANALLPYYPDLQSDQLWLQADHLLPVAGSVKARGGFYEVLQHASQLAQQAGLLSANSDSLTLLSDAAKQLFAQHRIAVGSTGNLGMAIGIMAALLGFQAEVHMSVEAKAWKKARLRQHGVKVIEHSGDYSRAVAAGRALAEQDPFTYFVDDERSSSLFSGYALAADQVIQALAEQGRRIDSEHPLLVYLPCGVGGAPGGIGYGLKRRLGDAVHLFFVEPCASPCILTAMASPQPQDVYQWGLDNQTLADGLAVPAASELVLTLLKTQLSGCMTVSDASLLLWLQRAYQQLQLQLEPSAAAGFVGPQLLLNSPEGRQYLAQQGLDARLKQTTHLIWTTGGSLVPENEFQAWLQLPN
ncbi:D-serine ammonia-lyase [Balneatrix alpica]|uniref:D-serine ammonia-lyase n=1 Tax=Balneatrix alpica TaxID=75684 RepID=UPI002739550F|nr:D-serine ammonia-lyase [Balneatrix alpica]